MASISDSPTAPDEPNQPNQSFGERAKEEVSSAREQFRHTGQAVREEAKGLASAVRNKVSDTIEDGKSSLTESLDDFTAAIRKACDELEEREQSSAANLVRHAADGLEQATQAVKSRSVRDIAGTVSDFARERPAVFIIGALLAGVALGRFARASGSQEFEDDYTDGGYTERGGYGDPYEY